MNNFRHNISGICFSSCSVFFANQSCVEKFVRSDEDENKPTIIEILFLIFIMFYPRVIYSEGKGSGIWDYFKIFFLRRNLKFHNN